MFIEEMIERLKKARVEMQEQMEEDPSDEIRQMLLDDGIREIDISIEALEKKLREEENSNG